MVIWRKVVFLPEQNQKVLWPRGLGTALQKLLHRFESDRDLEIKKAPFKGAFLLSIIKKLY